MERPDGKFIGELCSVCNKPIGRDFGGEVLGLASSEWVHVDCLAARFACPASSKNCFDKPDANTPCAHCINVTPEGDEDIQSLVWETAQ